MSYVEIKCPGPSGLGTTIEVDGKKLELTTDIKVHIPLDVPTVTVEQHFSGLEISGNFDVKRVFSFPDEPDKKYLLVEVRE